MMPYNGVSLTYPCKNGPFCSKQRFFNKLNSGWIKGFDPPAVFTAAPF